MARNNQARIRRAMERANQQLEADFREERADAAARFHNAIVDIIGEQNPSIETQLYVYERIKWELMAQRAAAPGDPVHVHTDSNGAASLAIGTA